ncbi:ABC transporter G family member 37 [Hordeum vulgare]|nr:ABC transporter G family member 37 [Hordeum vulgare]
MFPCGDLATMSFEFWDGRSPPVFPALPMGDVLLPLAWDPPSQTLEILAPEPATPQPPPPHPPPAVAPRSGLGDPTISSSMERVMSSESNVARQSAKLIQSWTLQDDCVPTIPMKLSISMEKWDHFRPSSGVKQGDFISSLLFNLVVEALAGILDKAKQVSHLRGVVSHLIPGGGVTHLQYVYDTMIMVEGYDLDIVNFKFLLLCFEIMSGLKINLNKSKLVVFGCSATEQQRIADKIKCRLTSFPISYLRMPMCDSRILVSGYDSLVG